MTTNTNLTYTLYLGCETIHEQTVIDASRDSYVDRFRSTHKVKLSVDSIEQAQQIVRAYLGEAFVSVLVAALLRFYYRDEAAKRSDFYQDSYEACLVIAPVVETADANECPF
jgi:hypothetical protein